jgi:hypothetical protein
LIQSDPCVILLRDLRFFKGQIMTVKKPSFLVGVALITFSVLLFQILQTRILSVIAWYYLAFFAISVAMLGMTVGAVWVYLDRERFQSTPLPVTLSKFALFTALAMPGSILLQFCLITTVTPSLTTIISWGLLLLIMAAPYVFSGVAVSLALTRSPFPIGQVYGADLLGAAMGCIAVIAVLNVLDAPTAVIVAGIASALSAQAFAYSDAGSHSKRIGWVRPIPVALGLAVLALVTSLSPFGLRPILVKDRVEKNTALSGRGYEKWNSYSRVLATVPTMSTPFFWGPSPKTPAGLTVPMSMLNIDGMAGTAMFHYDGSRDSISFLRYDLVNLAYNLPGIKKSAVIGVGGGRDILSAYLFGVPDITGVELNPIFINLLESNKVYKNFSNLTEIPNLRLYVDDARSWFASTKEKFDLVQMSMIDTWAATGAGAFSLSENGLYTLEGWRAFLRTIKDGGVFTVSRWYNRGEVNETGRMIGLATAALLDAGVKDPRSHLFVANTQDIATLVLSKAPLDGERLRILHEAVDRGGFEIILAPDQAPPSELLRRALNSKDIDELDRALNSSYLDLSVPRDSRPFFFNQLRLFDLPAMMTVMKLMRSGALGLGVVSGNLVASSVLLIILCLSIIAVITTIIVPLRSTATTCPRPLAILGSLYFSLIGMGFMLSEISLLQYFSVYLGHPIYSLGVCLFSLILASGLGSLASDKLKLDKAAKLAVWGLVLVFYLVMLETLIPDVFQATTNQERLVRIGISLAAIMPLGFLLGFGFPTGAGAQYLLRHQRFRRDAARPLGMGRQAARGQHRDRRSPYRAPRQRSGARRDGRSLLLSGAHGRLRVDARARRLV